MSIPKDTMATQKSIISTIKLQKETKSRLINLKTYKRETYEEIVQKMLSILNLCKINPERAQAKLRALDRQKRKIQVQNKTKFQAP